MSMSVKPALLRSTFLMVIFICCSLNIVLSEIRFDQLVVFHVTVSSRVDAQTIAFDNANSLCAMVHCIVGVCYECLNAVECRLIGGAIAGPVVSPNFVNRGEHDMSQPPDAIGTQRFFRTTEDWHTGYVVIGPVGLDVEFNYRVVANRRELCQCVTAGSRGINDLPVKVVIVMLTSRNAEVDLDCFLDLVHLLFLFIGSENCLYRFLLLHKFCADWGEFLRLHYITF